MKHTRVILLIALLTATAFGLPGLRGATITVMNTNDNGPGSLRQALTAVNDGDTINFDSSLNGQTIPLTSGELVVTKSVTISGPADHVAVDANHSSSVFHIASGKTVSISGLTITNGLASPFAANGGGIYNDHATLTVSDCIITGNSALNGGGIFNNGNSGSATLTLNNSTLSGNSAAGGLGGGGIFNAGGSSGSAMLIVNNSTLRGNSSAPFDGAGIFNDGSGGSATLTVNNSTLSGNSAAKYGGGICNYGHFGSAILTVTNSTISANSAGYNGGGIFSDGSAGSATLAVTNSTVSGNGYSGIHSEAVQGSATLAIGNTILNAGAAGPNISVFLSTATSLGFNLSSDNGGGLLTATGDQINTDPMLGPLQDNGGPTFTHELLDGSPAINAGDPNFDPYAFDPPILYDQRRADFSRVVNGRIDTGAFEVQASTIVCPQPQGYWKNNPDAWPVNTLTLGSQTYTKTELLNILATSIGNGSRADASLILGDQLIAAKLNIATGADPTPIRDTITDTDAVLSLYSGTLPYGVRTNSTNGQRMVNDGTMLESYNKGDLTPGCGE